MDPFLALGPLATNIEHVYSVEWCKNGFERKEGKSVKNYRDE